MPAASKANDNETDFPTKGHSPAQNTNGKSTEKKSKYESFENLSICVLCFLQKKNYTIYSIYACKTAGYRFLFNTTCKVLEIGRNNL